MISTPLVQLLIRCRSSLPAVRERALGELDALDPAAMSVEDCAALIAVVPDLESAAARRLLEFLHFDLGSVDSVAIERVHAKLPAELSHLVVGILARQHRPEAWLSLRRVMHRELARSDRCPPLPDVLEPLGGLCDEPTFALDALIEAIDDPMWTVHAAQCIITWHQRSLLCERDVARVRETIPVLEALIEDAKTDALPGSNADHEAIDRLFPERPILTGP